MDPTLYQVKILAICQRKREGKGKRNGLEDLDGVKEKVSWSICATLVVIVVVSCKYFFVHVFFLPL